MFKIGFLILILSNLSYAQKVVTCDGNACVGNFSAQSVNDRSTYTAIEVGPNLDNISVAVTQNVEPRSLRISVENGGVPRNLLINLSSTRPTANAGNAMVVGDIFSNLQIKLDGYSGKKGKDASQICAENIKAAQYGIDAKNFFEQRRAADPSLNPNRCDRIDLTYLQTYAFSCTDPSYGGALYQEVPGPNPLVEVNRMRSKARCTGILVQDLCVKIKRRITCNWQGYVTSCSKYGCTNSDSGGIVARIATAFEEERMNALVAQLGASSFCQSYIGMPSGNYYLKTWTSSRTEPGVNAQYQLLPGSNWEVYRTQAYGQCNTYWARVRTESVAKMAYDEFGTSCSSTNISIPEDPNRIIPWVYAGMAQEPEFGSEVLQCALGECPVNSTLSDLQATLDVIVPQSGDNGTQQGNGVALIYDATVLDTSAIIGQAGAAGLSDLDSPTSTKYCVRVRDSLTDGLNSEFSRQPSVSFRRYNWQAIKTNGGGNNGVQPPGSLNSIDVYKKVDPSVRYLITKETF